MTTSEQPETPRPMLTPAQHRLALLRAAGVPTAEMARRLGVQVNTVRDRSWDINKRLGIRTRRELAQALETCVIGFRYAGRKSRRGYVMGGPVDITGGAYAGRTGHYVGSVNTLQIRVRVGGAVVQLQAAHVKTGTP